MYLHTYEHIIKEKHEEKKSNMTQIPKESNVYSGIRYLPT